MFAYCAQGKDSLFFSTVRMRQGCLEYVEVHINQSCEGCEMEVRLTLYNNANVESVLRPGLLSCALLKPVLRVCGVQTDQFWFQQ